MSACSEVGVWTPALAHAPRRAQRCGLPRWDGCMQREAGRTPTARRVAHGGDGALAAHMSDQRCIAVECLYIKLVWGWCLCISRLSARSSPM